tara:strand:+ start:200 stop:517 length:318 start_codon:yes stop_codon:yes gene_type:complete
MAALQIQIAELIKEQFAELPDYEVWRDCGGTLHWTATKDGKVIEATCYCDDDNYDLICDLFDEDEDEEDIEHTDDEEESEEEEDSDDDDFIVDDEEEPMQKKRKV